jgi:hypothetical protein
MPLPSNGGGGEIEDYLGELRAQRRNRQPFERQHFDFSMSPEVQQIVEGRHRVDNTRMDALRGDIARMAEGIKPLKQGMDNEGNIQDQAGRLGNFSRQQRQLDDIAQKKDPVGGFAAAGNPESIQPARPPRQQVGEERTPQRDSRRPGGGRAELARMGLQGISALLGHLANSGGKKVAKTDDKGNKLKDASGQTIYEKRPGKNKVLDYLSKNVGGLGNQLIDHFTRPRQNAPARRRNPHQIAGQEEQE